MYQKPPGASGATGAQGATGAASTVPGATGATGPQGATGAPSTEFAINVKDYGAVGDGATDDTLALNNAVTAAIGKDLWFPPGVYTTTTGITLPASATINLYGGSGATIRATATMTSVITKYAGASNGVIIDSINIDANQIAARCVDIEQAHLMYIEGGVWSNATTVVADFGRQGGQAYELTWRRTRVVGIDDTASGATQHGYLDLAINLALTLPTM